MESGLAPLNLTPRPCIRFKRVLTGAQLFSFGIILSSPAPLPVKLLLLLGIFLQRMVSHRKWGEISPHRPKLVRIDSTHEVRLVYADGREMFTRLRGDSVVTSWLILLKFECVDRRLSCPSLLLGPDSLNADEARQLRILLRFGGVPAESGQ